MSLPPDTLERARAWSLEIQSLLDSRSQLTKRGVLLALLLSGFAMLGLGVHSLSDTDDSLNTVQSPYPGAALGLSLLASYAWLRGRHRIEPAAIAGVVVFTSVIVMAASVLNGLAAVLLLPAGLVFTHLMLPPRQALWAGGITTAFALAALFTLWPDVDIALKLRVAAASLLILAFMQMFGRHASGMTQRFGAIGHEMSSLVVQLDAEVASAQAQRDAALITDAATGLPNRVGFERLLTARLGPLDDGHATIVASIRLMAWRDAMTHLPPLTQAALLEALVRRLKGAFGETTLLGCVGPAEFAVALGVHGFEDDDLMDGLNASLSRLQQTVTHGTSAAVTQPRMGVSLYPQDGTDAAALISKAELALVTAEQIGAERPCRFEPAMLTQAADRTELLSEIKRGLESGQFELFYQPIVSTRGGPLKKAEGLIRWNHPERGRVSPGAFIPLAEKTELIIDITNWVLSQAICQVRQWRQELDPAFQISVNMPPAYLMRFVQDPARTLEYLEQLDAPPQSIVLEITEGVMLNVTPELEQAFSMLRYLGFQIALDDFGIGYSSFAQLDKLALDFLKIDKTFVDRLQAAPHKRAVCGAIVRVAHELGFKVVAEGVETQAQQGFLKAMDCDYLQGYLLARPLPADEMLAWARRLDAEQR